MRKYLYILVLVTIQLSLFGQKFTLDAVKSYAFPTELVRSAKGDKIAWALDEKGVRNIYVAEAPNFVARKLTSFVDEIGRAHV